jgi:predicted amidohydrolase YtcJ
LGSLGGLGGLGSGRRAVTVLAARTIRPDYVSGEAFRFLVITGGTVTALAETSDEAAHAAGPSARWVELGDACVAPGFVDTHIHALQAAADARLVSLREATTIAGLLAAVREAGRRRGAGEWTVSARNWHESRLREGRLPVRAELDALGLPGPVLLRRGSHLAVADSRAIALLGPGSLPAGAADTGLIDADPVIARAVALAGEPGPGQRRDDLAAVLARFAGRGITSIREAGVDAAELALFSALRDQGRLPVRCHLLWRVPEGSGADEARQRIAEMPPPEPADGGFLRLTGVKAFVDGRIADAAIGAGAAGAGADGAAGAGADGAAGQGTGGKDRAGTGPAGKGPAGTDPAGTDPADSGPASTDPAGPDPAAGEAAGCLRISPAELQVIVVESLRRSVGVGCHAVGDAAVRMVLGAYERALSAGLAAGPGRLVIEHALDCAPATIRRIAAAGVAVSVHPAIAFEFADDIRRHWGTERAARAAPVRDMVAAGVRVAAGSDGDVPPFDPLLGVAFMVTRVARSGGPLGAGQAVPANIALDLYTRRGAALLGTGTRRGVLRPGMDADLAAFSADPLGCPAGDLPGVSVLLTMAGGRAVHDPDGLLEEDGHA